MTFALEFCTRMGHDPISLGLKLRVTGYGQGLGLELELSEINGRNNTFLLSCHATSAAR